MRMIIAPALAAAFFAVSACGGQGDDTLGDRVEDQADARADQLEDQAEQIREAGEAQEEAIDESDVQVGEQPAQ